MQHRSNPVLDADWPDPDAIRVGEEYWMVASSFNRAPGLPILRSRNLVDWEHVTNALPAVPPQEHFSLPRRGGGVWAPSFRHHGGKFYIMYGDPEHGIYVLSASHPGGPWSEPHLLVAGYGMIDTCPFWDDDGRAYVVHGWARSQAGVNNRLSLFEVTTDLDRPLSPGQIIIDGDQISGMRTLEGPKAYAMNGWYWIFAPAGGVAPGYQVVFRARDIHGPYEHRVVLEQGSTAVNGPHQGALVDDGKGSHWFIHFQDRGVFGRVTHVQPVRFDADGWPHMGEPIDEVRGQPVEILEDIPGEALHEDLEYSEPRRSDDFTTPVLHPRWHWQANPGSDWWRYDGSGTIEFAFVPSPREDLRRLGSILSQQMPGRASRWSTELHLPGALPLNAEEGTERAGMVILGWSYAWFGLQRTHTGVALTGGTMAADDVEETALNQHLLTTDPRDDVRVQLHIFVDACGLVTLQAREASVAGHGVPTPRDDLLSQWQSTRGHWIGAEIGLFATSSGILQRSLDDRHVAFGPVGVSVGGHTS